VEHATTEIKRDVFQRGFKQIGRALASHVDDVVGSHSCRGATDLQRLRATGSTTVVDVVGVAEAELDLVHRNTCGLRHDHRPRRGVTLTV
jgi:hypothetical protein